MTSCTAKHENLLCSRECMLTSSCTQHTLCYGSVRCIIVVTNFRVTYGNKLIRNRRVTLKFQDIVKVRSLLLLYRAFHRLLPSSVQISFKHASKTHNTRSQNRFAVDFSRTTTKRQSTVGIGVKLWNNLPQYITDCKILASFKTKLKKYYVQGYAASSDC